MGRGELPLHSPTRCCHRCREPCTRSAVRPSVVLDVLSTRQEALIALGGVARCSHGWIADPCYVSHPRPVECLPCRRAVHRLEGCAWCEGSRALHCACFVAPRAPLNRSTKRKSFLEGSMIGRAQLSQIPQAGWADSKLPGLSPSPRGRCNGALRGSRADPTSTLVGRVVLGGRGSVVPQSQLVRWHSCCVARYEDAYNPHLSQILSRYGHHHGSHPIHATLSGGTRPTTDLSALPPGPGCCHVLASWHPSPLPSPCHLLPLPL
jgi:hypothetical protein